MKSEMQENLEEKIGVKTGKKESWTGLTLAVICVVLIGGIALGYFAGISLSPGTGKSTDISVITPKLENYLTTNFLAKYNASAKIVNYTDLGNIVEFSISIMGDNGTELDKGTVFTTKDGGYMVDLMYNLSAPFPTQPSTTVQNQTAATSVPKTDKPKVELYVMSFCPYGNRAENTMLPVYNLLKDKVDWSVHYIVSVNGNNTQSLHGQPEVDQNMREACVLADYGMDKWWNFTVYVNNNCGSNGNCWEAAASAAGIDSSKISECVSARGLSLMQFEAAATNAAGAGGSPTLILNGVESSAVYNYENPEAYKTAICSAFNSAPGECSTALTGSSVSTATGGSC